MVMIIVPYPCGTIFSILLIIMGIFTLSVDTEGGFSMIIFGAIFLAINQAIAGSGRSRSSPTGLRENSVYNHSNSGGLGNIMINYCPECSMEFTVTGTSNLCPNCQVPLQQKTGSYSRTQIPRKDFYFENQ